MALQPPGDNAFVSGPLDKKWMTDVVAEINASRKWEITVPQGYTAPTVRPSKENTGLDLTKTLPPFVTFQAWLSGILVQYSIPAKLQNP